MDNKESVVGHVEIEIRRVKDKRKERKGKLCDKKK